MLKRQAQVTDDVATSQQEDNNIPYIVKVNSGKYTMPHRELQTLREDYRQNTTRALEYFILKKHFDNYTVALFNLYLTSKYFIWNGTYDKQRDKDAVGRPLSPW